MTIISISISPRDKEFLDLLVKMGKFTSRSATITEAIKLLKEQECAGKRMTSPHTVQRYKPVMSRITIQADSYYFPTTETENPEELRTELMNELKQKQIERNLRPADPIQDIDAGFDMLEFDPTKCKYPILKKGKITQCQNFKVDGEDYCYEHLK